MIFEHFLKSLKPFAPLNISLDKKRIMIAKTTHVGDVVISLPMAGILKYYYPNAQILFLAKGPACDIAKRYSFVDEVYDEKIIDTPEGLKACNADIFIQVNTSKKLAHAAKKADIPVRIGSAYRYFNWLFCTHWALISRQHWQFNKRQLDLDYLKLLNINHHLSYEDLSYLYQFTQKPLINEETQWLEPIMAMAASSHKFKLILHPSLITAKKYQWPLDYFQQLMESLDPEKFQIFITGVESDRPYLQPLLDKLPSYPQNYVIDLVGKLSMDDFITFISHSDGLIAGSTGPLHLAAALGIHALGIYRADIPYIRRWEAVGLHAEVLAQQGYCKKCPSADPCQCITAVKPEFVQIRVQDWQKNSQVD